MEGNKRSLVLAGVFLAAGVLYYAYTEFIAEPPAEQAAPQPDEPTREDAERADTPRALTAEERQRLQRTATIRTDRFEATIDNLGGGIFSYRLINDARFQQEGRPVELATTIDGVGDAEYEPLRFELARLPLPPNAVWEIEQVSPREVQLTWEGNGLRIVRSLKAGDGPYQIWSTDRVVNTANYPRRTRAELSVFHYVARESESGGISFLGSRSPQVSQGTCVYADETTRKDRDALAPEEGRVPHGYGSGDVHFAAVENVYFVQAVAADAERSGDGSWSERRGARCALYGENRGSAADPHGTLFQSAIVYPWTTIAPGAEHTWRTLAYLGPKEPRSLAAAGHRLPEVVDLGWFALIAAQLANLLSWIQGLVGNWGLAIILLTLLVRLALFPLTNLSFKSMARMRQLKPDIDRINELYAGDQEKKGAAIMELYRRNKVNPLSGCLPSLLQLPVFWALYTSLSTNIELYHMPFVWPWTDLAAPDPYFLLPLALGALMHVQQRISPAAMDPAQAKMMMWFMPIMITVFMLFLPSGLCLYMLTSSALGIGQQKLNEWRISREVPPSAEVASDEDGADDDDVEDGTSSDDPAKRRPKRKRQRRMRRGRA